MKGIDVPSVKNVIAVAALLLLFSFSAFGSEEPPGPDIWPKTVADVVKDILSGMSDKDKQLLMNTKEEDLIRFHHGWGTGIRNHYGLWRGNAELIKSACGKPCHPDDASMIIIKAVWAELKKK